MTTAGGGVVIGLLGAGVVYLLAKGKEKSDQISELEQGPLEQPEQPGREGRPLRPPSPRAGMPGRPPPPAPRTQVAPQPLPSYTWQGDASLPPLEPGQPHHHYPHGYPPRRTPGPQYGAPAYPPQQPAYPPAYPPAPRSYPHAPPPPPAPVRRAGASAAIPGPLWVRATQADVNRDGVSDWYVGLLNSVRRPGYSEERTIGGRRWKLMVVSAAAHPELTARVRDVLGWVMHGPARPAPPPPSLAHGAYPYPPAQHARSPYPAPPQVAYHQAPQVPYGGGSAFAPSSWPAPSGGPPPWQQPGQPPAHHHEHPRDHAPHPTMAFAAPAPGGSGDCQNWKPATDADVHQDGVATVYQSMLSLPETAPPRIEVHKGRTWKFQVVTPTSDPSFGFASGVTKSVRGWVCADAPRPDTSDPGY